MTEGRYGILPSVVNSSETGKKPQDQGNAVDPCLRILSTLHKGKVYPENMSLQMEPKSRPGSLVLGA